MTDLSYTTKSSSETKYQKTKCVFHKPLCLVLGIGKTSLVRPIKYSFNFRSNKNNNEWNAGAMSTQFGNNLNQKILLSRKETSPYTNTLVAINKVWTMKPESPMGMPKLQNKGGMSMWYDATLVVTFGNITNPGTSKIKAIKDGMQVEFAKRTITLQYSFH